MKKAYLRIKNIKDEKILDLLCEKYEFKKQYDIDTGKLSYLTKRFVPLIFDRSGSYDIVIRVLAGGKIEINNLTHTSLYGGVSTKSKTRARYFMEEGITLFCEMAMEGLIEIS